MNSTKYWIALEQAEGIGPAHLLEIQEKISGLGLTAADLFSLEEKEIMEEFGLSQKLSRSICSVKSSLDKIDSDYVRLINSGISIVPFFSREYPARLKEILGHALPPILYTFGNIKLFPEKGAAILGGKEISEKGENIASMSAKILARHGIVTISGLAAGTGLTAHRSALDGGGSTIAVVPYGMHHLSLPDFMMNLMSTERILIVSPFYPSRETNRFNAMIRNRIICALAHAVFFIEAATESGTMEAVKSAHKLGVPIFTTEYGKYPETALGNRDIIGNYGGIPVKGKRENNILVPNMDSIIGVVKYG